ncbi:hypothetical protein BDB13_6188 [Rhodococcus sp. OK302]|nr:hypothetical protein BDB13_6188 [Rhodococcus sp. OK302]
MKQHAERATQCGDGRAPTRSAQWRAGYRKQSGLCRTVSTATQGRGPTRPVRRQRQHQRLHFDHTCKPPDVVAGSIRSSSEVPRTERGGIAARCDPPGSSTPRCRAGPGDQSCRGCNASFMLSTPRACADRSARADRTTALRLRDPDSSESPSEFGTPSSRCPRALPDSSRSACARSKDSDFGVFRIRALFQNQARRRQPVRRHRRVPAPTSRYLPAGVALAADGKFL